MNRHELDISQAHNSSIIIAHLRRIMSTFSVKENENLPALTRLIESIDELLTTTPESVESDIWRLINLSLHTLRTHVACRAIAMGNEGDLSNEQMRLSVLSKELKTQLDNYSSNYEDRHQITQGIVNEARETINADRLIAFIQALPIPITYQKNRTELHHPGSVPEENEEPKPSTIQLVRLVAFIDNAPLVSPQLLKPQLTYSLRFNLSGTMWPDAAERLRLDLMTTYPKANFSVSDFVLERPSKKDIEFYQEDLSGHIQFSMAQTLLSDSVFFSIQCAYDLGDLGFLEVPIIGHNQLEFRIVDPAGSGLLSHYRRLDKHVYELLEDLIKEQASVRDELPELLPLLTAMTNLLGTYSQGSVFGQTVKLSERDFQKSVLKDLRLALGEDVEEHPSQAGGYTDLRYYGVVIELKVESENGDREYICNKYSKQVVQYESVEGRQVSVLLVLDLTPKLLPPGDIRNDIFLVDVSTHGGGNDFKRYPSKTFVFVINGNIQQPSAYSRS